MDRTSVGDLPGPMSVDITPQQRAVPVEPSSGRLRPVPAADVRLRAGFWADRQRLNATASIAHAQSWMERLGWIANFDRTAAGDNSTPAGREFADSEIYKLLEAMAWELSRNASADLEDRFERLAARVIAAQQPDGYLGTRFGGTGQQSRYSDLERGHELYCAGHLIQAAVARVRTHGPDLLLRTAIRVANHICQEFGVGARDAVCGHPGIEAALVELSRVTADPRYLEQARLFVERRGRGLLVAGEMGSEYFLDDKPARDADVLRGHAVRAMYFASGAVDVAIETHDVALIDAVETQWERTVAARTYLTGGMGSRHEGESFGADFELPSDRAYSETCAGIGSIMLSWRLLLARGDMRYSDLIERTLFNVLATSPDEHGTAFFYVNPLQRNVPGIPAALDRASERAASSQRAPWFEVSCCPTNVARTFASLSGYFATTDDAGLQLHQYATCDIRTTLPNGNHVALRVHTLYPLDGVIAVTVDEAPQAGFSLTMRIPSWARHASTVDATGREVVISPDSASVAGLKAGDVVTLTLPIEPRFTEPDPQIDALRACVAVEAGPLVYCVETLGDDITNLALVKVDVNSAPTFGRDDIIRVRAAHETSSSPAWPYSSQRPAAGASSRSVEIELIPYHRWAERGPSTMRVWMPVKGRSTSTAKSVST